MERIPPSERMRKELREVTEGIDRERFVFSELIKKASCLVLQEMLEGEVSDFLGRGYYERVRGQEGKPSGYRNGYEPLGIKTSEGKIKVFQPQERGSETPFKSRLSAFFRGNSEVVEKLAIEMYARGLSTRDIEDAVLQATGDMVLSKTAVSKVTEVPYREFEEFQRRDLGSFEVEYLFLDAIYESLRKRYGLKEAVLCAWGILRGGEKVLLHVSLGNKESYADWLEFLRDLVKRGLRIPTSITSDGAPGVIRAIDAIFPQSLRIRCWYHRMENFCGKVPQEVWPFMKAQLMMIRDATSYEQGKQLSAEFISQCQETYPSLVKAFQEDLDSLLNHLKVPLRHRKNVRTTNLIERSFEEERRRTKVIPSFLTEKSGLKLVFAALIRASKRWQRLQFLAYDLNYLDRLRKELGIDNDTEEVTKTFGELNH